MIFLPVDAGELSCWTHWILMLGVEDEIYQVQVSDGKFVIVESDASDIKVRQAEIAGSERQGINWKTLIFRLECLLRAPLKSLFSPLSFFQMFINNSNLVDLFESGSAASAPAFVSFLRDALNQHSAEGWTWTWNFKVNFRVLRRRSGVWRVGGVWGGEGSNRKIKWRNCYYHLNFPRERDGWGVIRVWIFYMIQLQIFWLWW